MFVVDYKQQLLDHGKFLILVKNFKPKCPDSLFEQAFQSISKHHPLVYAKHSVSRNAVRRDKAEFLLSIPAEFHYEPSEETNFRMRPIYLRYIRDFSSVNQAWASFQAHRAVVGLIGLCCCSTAGEVEETIRVYIEQKALISENPVNGRLFLLIPTSDSSRCGISVEHANQIIQEEQKRMPQGLLLTPDEILAHPIEQFFNLEFQHTQEAVAHSNTIQARIFSSGFESFDKPSSNGDTVLRVTSIPILNPRLAGALVDLTSRICHDLDRVLITADPKSAKFLTSPATAPALDASDGDSSDSTFSALTGTNASKSTRMAGVFLHPEDRLFTSRPYISSSMNTGSSPNLASSSSNDAGFNLFNAIKQRRNSGRWKKHLADLSLQLGEYDLAHLYYEASLQLLRPLLDNLWIAGALEGLSAVAVLRNAAQIQPPIGYSRLPTSVRQGPRASEGVTADKADEFPARNRSYNTTSAAVFTPRESCAAALDALELYRKGNVESGFLEETTFKIIRLLIAEQQSVKACELIDYMLRTTMEGEKDEAMNITKRLTTIVDLYRDLGYRRRAGFVAWQAFVQNLRLPGEENFDALFSGLAIQFTPSNAFDSILWVHYTESHSTEDAARQLFLRCPGTPANLIPLTVPETSLWFRGSSGGVRSGTLAHTFFKPNRSAKRWGTKSHRMLPERLTYRHTGWASLQASAVWIMIQRLKADLRFDDVTDISWEMALRLTGFIFSLLDCWPDYLDEIRTETCLDDLRRLAVMRSPDQPRIADPSASFFTSDVSGNADSQCRHHKIQGGLANGSLLKRSSGILRQLVDLLEVPTHGLPSVQTINLLPLPNFLLPCELSKEALASAVHIPASPTTGERVPSELSQSTDSAVYNTNSDRPPGLFYYAPTELNGKTQENFKVIDWVCEEPVAIELMVDNLLPVSLRLSDIRIELSQVFTGPITCTSTPNASTNVLLSSGRPGPVLVHLEAFRVSLEKSVTGVRTPLGTRHRASTPFTTAYGVELNQACLLESAHFKYLHPYVKLDAVWQRRLGHVRCTIPAKTIGNRLVIHVVPPTSMLLAVDNQPHAIESSARSYYRVSGISYRLVDFGAMHACLRVPSDLLYLDPVVNLPHEIPQTPVHERHLSHSSSSALSISSGLRSSATCETDSALNSILPSDSLPQHPIVSLIRNLFVDLPAIRLRPAMPRLCIFPGIARSAHTLTEAANFLPQLTVPLVNTDNTAKLTTSPLDISAPKFHIPVSEHWSQHVATLFHVSVYPYESRWLPLRIFVRDEGQQATTSPQSHVIPPTASRQLNVLHISVKSTDESAQLLRKLNLIPNDLVKCHNWDSIQRKMPFPVCNKQIAMTPVVCISDGVYLEDDSVSPTHATECGLIWLSFHSEAFWRNLYRWFTQPLRRKDQDMKDIGFRNSQAVMLEIHIEYALDAPCKENHSTIHTNGPQLFPEQPTLARRVGIGIHLSLLSSKHSPLLLYYPQLTFRDELERQSSDSKVPNSMGIAANVDPESKALFSCTLRARLPASLVPRHLRSPGRQYRVRLEVSSKWTTPGAQLDQPAFTISTPWTSLFEQNSHIPVSTRISTQALSPVSAELDGPVSPFAYTTTEMFHSLGDLDAIAVNETTSSDHLTYHHHINLSMEQLSKVVFGSGDVHLVNSKELSTDEIGLPLPVNTEATIHLIESHIWITWKSWLDGRLSHSPNTSSMERLNVMLPDSRFYRFGRLCLAAHNVELPVPEQPSLADAQAKSTVSRYWFGNAFTNLASTAGLLWCHNLHLTLNMPKPMSRPEFPEFNLQNICHSCLGDSTGRKILPSFSRCMSQPTESFSSHMPKATTSQPLGGLDEINENTPWDSAANPAPHRRFSIPEFRHPRQLQGVPANLLPSFLHICVPLMSPLPLRVESRVAYNPMDDLHVVDPHIPSVSTEVIAVNIHRVWTCPVVYEIVEEAEVDSDGKTKLSTKLSSPLVDGKDFGFFGRCGGIAGLQLNGSISEVSTQPSSVVFYRPGQFWICGLLGLLPPKSTVVSPDLPACNTFSLPTPSSLETIRFSANGLRVHVFDPDDK